MITIQEQIPKKLSGLTSLFITFPYNEKAVDYLKSRPTYYYHRKTFTWEVPITDLGDILDALVLFDDLELKLQESYSEDCEGETPVQGAYDSRYSLKESEIKSFRIKPYDHQLEAINYGLDPKHSKFLLLDSMGLGKTLEVIWLAETLKRRGQIEHCLIICGVNAVKLSWEKEIKKYSTETCTVLGKVVNSKGTVRYETVAKRAEILKKKIDEFFVITNIETLRHDKIIEAFKKSENKFGLIAVDEAHRALGNKSSQQASNLLKLDSAHKVAMTGTLLTNSPLSAYGSLSFTENDKSILTCFKSQYCKFGGFRDSQVIGYKNLELLKEEIDSCSIRRTLDQVKSDMPSKTITTEYVEMSDEHSKFYEAIKAGVKEEADKIQLNSNNLLALTTRLRQAVSCPEILTSQKILSTKIERCVELVEELIEQGEKVVILSTFKSPVYTLANLLAKYQPLVSTGDTPDGVASDNETKFQSDENFKIIIGTHGKLGTGITLNRASYMIMIDTPFTYSDMSQSCDRIWRISNTRPAFIKVLVAKNTVDERVLQIVNTKKELSDYVVDDAQNGLSQSMKDDMLSLIKGL